VDDQDTLAKIRETEKVLYDNLIKFGERHGLTFFREDFSHRIVSPPCFRYMVYHTGTGRKAELFVTRELVARAVENNVAHDLFFAMRDRLIREMWMRGVEVEDARDKNPDIWCAGKRCPLCGARMMKMVSTDPGKNYEEYCSDPDCDSFTLTKEV